MAYTTNPNLPHVRMDAVKLMRSGWSTRKVARHTGFNQSTIVRWNNRAPDNLRAKIIPTLSSRPFHHPNELSDEIVQRILFLRNKHHRCAEVIHYLLKKEGISICLSSVKRTLKRNGLIRTSKWKKWHQYPPRPIPEKPGILVQIDTIFDGIPENRVYIYTLIDVFSRWTYALPKLNISTHKSLSFVKQAQIIAPFKFNTLQSDHGSEFSKWFTKRIMENGFSHRHSRIRTPSDNGHLERFNRTIQEECLSRVSRNLKSYQKEIPKYLHFYNYERPHMALDMKTPIEILNQNRCQAID